MLRRLMSQAAAVPLHAMKEIQRELIAAQGEFTKQHFEAQNALLENLAPHSDADPLRKLREKDPNFRHSPERASTC